VNHAGERVRGVAVEVLANAFVERFHTWPHNDAAVNRDVDTLTDANDQGRKVVAQVRVLGTVAFVEDVEGALSAGGVAEDAQLVGGQNAFEDHGTNVTWAASDP
jgi:hypothetical protein